MDKTTTAKQPLWMALWTVWTGLLITFLLFAAVFKGPAAVNRTVFSSTCNGIILMFSMFMQSLVVIQGSLVKMSVALGSVIVFLAFVCPLWSVFSGISVIFGITVVSLGASWFWVGAWILMLLAWQLNGGEWFAKSYDWIAPSIPLIARTFVRNFARERLENLYVSPGYVEGLLIMAMHLLLTLPGLFLVILGFVTVWESLCVIFMGLPILLVGIMFVIFALVPVFVVLRDVCLTLGYIDVLEKRT